MTMESSAVRWLVIGVSALGVYALRVSFIALWDRLNDVPARVEYALALVPAAVLATFVVPGIFAPDGTMTLSPANGRLFAAPVAIVVAYRTESILWTLVAGVVALLCYQAVVL